METIIIIEGQPNGNSRLVRAISTYESVKKDIGFNHYALVFKTKKEAKKALWEGWKYLKRNEPEFVRKDDYSKHGFLRYDASSARIIDNF